MVGNDAPPALPGAVGFVAAMRWRARELAATATGLLLAMLTACGTTPAGSVSTLASGPQAGQVCVKAQELQAQGIAVGLDRAQGTDYVMLSRPLPRRASTTFVRNLKAGTRFQVLSGPNFTNCPQDELVAHRVVWARELKEFQGWPV